MIAGTLILLAACANKNPLLKKEVAKEFATRYETLETQGFKSATCDIEMQSLEMSDVPRFENLATVTFYTDNDATVKVEAKSPEFKKGPHYSLVELAVKAALPLTAVSPFAGDGVYVWRVRDTGYFNYQNTIELTLNKELDSLRIINTEQEIAELHFERNSRGKLRLQSYVIDYRGKGKVQILLNYDDKEKPYMLSRIVIPEVPLNILLTNCEAKK